MGGLLDVPIALVDFLVVGDWILGNSSEAFKVSIVMLGPTDISSYYRADTESRLRMIIK